MIKTKTSRHFSLVVAGLCLLAASVASAGQPPVGTAFTYQGRLDIGGAPATGSFDFQFTLFNAPTGVTSTTLTISRDDVAVAGGLFTVELDFGAGAFPAEARWLEIAVRPGAQTGAHTTLVPRTRLNPTPYAVHASAADSVGGLAGSEILQRIRSFTVAAGKDVQAGQVVSFVGGSAEIQPGYGLGIDGFGSGQVFRVAGLETVSAVALSPTQIVVTSLVGGVARAVVGQISGDSILFGPEAGYSTVGTSGFAQAICALSPTRVLVATSYVDFLGILFAHRMGVAVADVNGNALSFGTEVLMDAVIPSAVSTSFYQSLALTALSSTQAILAYRRGNALGLLIPVAVAGLVPSGVPPIPFNLSDTESIALTTLTPTQFVLAYRDTGNVTLGTTIVASIAGSVVTLGPEMVFNTGSTDRVSVAALASDRFVVSYRDVGSSNAGASVVGTVSGSSPTFGPEAVFNPGATGPTSTRAVGPGAFVVAYTDEANAFGGTVALGTVTGDAIAFGRESVFDPAATTGLSVVVPNSTSIVLAYRDGGNSGFGTAVVGHLRPTSIIGVARASGSAGMSVPVTLFVNHAVSELHSGLTPGASYFGQPDGSINTDDFGIPLGIAISATEILFTP